MPFFAFIPAMRIWRLPFQTRILHVMLFRKTGRPEGFTSPNLPTYVLAQIHMNLHSSVSDTDCASPAKTFKDFSKEEKPKGAQLLDAEGRLVGMLAVANFGERKVYPVFLPTLKADSNSDGPSKFIIFSIFILENPFHCRSKHRQYRVIL